MRTGCAALAALLLGVLTACGYGSQRPETTAPEQAVATGEALSAPEVTVGYFANLTHGTALVGLGAEGPIREELGGTRLGTQVFNAGPSAIEALNAGAVDMTFIGPNPAINGFAQSGGRNLRIVSGAASGGASLVVNPDTVNGLDDLTGKRIATPQLGNTQDVALLSYLEERGLEVDPRDGTGEVSVLRIQNSEIPPAFENGSIDGAWVPEPTASKLLTRGAVTLLDEGELWAEGRYVVTHLVVAQDFLEKHPDVVEAVVRGVVRTNGWIAENPGEAKSLVNDVLEELTGQRLPPEVLDPAFDNVEFLDDPLADTLRVGAEHAVEVGLLEETDLSGIYDLSILNAVLDGEGLPPITDDAGLGVD
ncbi:aliphatic sulfonate ABC transporter substrate-binding protein [Streptomyces alkaliphilus]|uniref:Aliphatic sulfonate ABC transporter substrate-binding protein n=1 Tax=Streptomyces alkaliphilus TaxID=1472722 RepID=A0A7W3Y2D3_9ACTN|nr:aliphatic sulfonate ABC transporter substrate-binding protein [Streptomyces alkaliphilus]MBB0245215.1 aliphatic sulfonate ABC transporter substrate-binding protein [Streptomyces alkaliphilus]